jgi:di/tricarboxylate transporter
LRGAYFTDQSRALGMAEVMLPPNSELIGHTGLDVGFRSKYRLNVIGLRRGRKSPEKNPATQKLRAGDVLLVIGRWKHIREVQEQKQNFLVLNLPAEVEQYAPAESRAPYALGSLAVMVALMVTGWVPNAMAALIACLLMGLTRCITLPSAYKSIQWPSLILIVGMLPFSTALQKTGGVDLAVQGLLHLFGKAEPRLLIAALFVVTALIGLFVSNTATAVLMAPIALRLAAAVGASPHPFVMTVALAASAAFMTPVSSPVNILVMVPGNYRFADFLRIGVPFTVVTLIITVILVPWLLPLYPGR